ncbi:hypothetical protein WJX77_003104 [Trebouxia sp. C0004]
MYSLLCHWIYATACKSLMDEVFINQEADPYVLEADGTLDVAAFQLQPGTIVINGKKGLVDGQTSKTKRTFANIQQKVLHDTTAGSMTSPLLISGASLAGMTTAFADHPFQKLSSNIEMQTHAVLQLGKAPPCQEKMAKESKQQDIMKDVTQALKESFGDNPTFAALQGKQLQFEGDQRPFKRCLAFQASQSQQSPLSQGCISPSAIPEIDTSAWSHNSYLERIKDYLADPEFQYQVGPIDRLDSISEFGKLDDSG